MVARKFSCCTGTPSVLPPKIKGPRVFYFESRSPRIENISDIEVPGVGYLDKLNRINEYLYSDFRLDPEWILYGPFGLDMAWTRAPSSIHPRCHPRWNRNGGPDRHQRRLVLRTGPRNPVGRGLVSSSRACRRLRWCVACPPARPPLCRRRFREASVPYPLGLLALLATPQPRRKPFPCALSAVRRLKDGKAAAKVSAKPSYNTTHGMVRAYA